MPQTFHYRFDSRAEFLAAATAAGWPNGPEGEPLPPEGGAFDEVGPLVAPPTVAANFRPVPGQLLDARWHVNVMWPADMPHDAFAAALVTPETPARVFALSPPPSPALMQPPVSVAAWKGKEVLKRMNLLDDAQAAAEAAGGMVLLAWNDAGEWELDSELLAGMANALGLSRADIEAMFIETLSIQG